MLGHPRKVSVGALTHLALPLSGTRSSDGALSISDGAGLALGPFAADAPLGDVLAAFAAHDATILTLHAVCADDDDGTDDGSPVADEPVRVAATTRVGQLPDLFFSATRDCGASCDYHLLVMPEGGYVFCDLFLCVVAVLRVSRVPFWPFTFSFCGI